MIFGCSPCVFSSNANARSCRSVSERRYESPTLFAAFFILFEYSSWGIFIFTLPLSMAVLKRTCIIEFLFISSCTFGTVTCSSPSEKGSNPAKNADVSNMIIFFCVLLLAVMIFGHLGPWNSNLQFSRS